MLSHHEQRELHRIEEWFESADPDLAARLSDHRDHTASRHDRHVEDQNDQAAARVMLSGGYLLGIILLISGFSSGAFVLIFLGIVVMVSTGTAHVNRRS